MWSLTGRQLVSCHIETSPAWLGELPSLLQTDPASIMYPASMFTHGFCLGQGPVLDKDMKQDVQSTPRQILTATEMLKEGSHAILYSWRGVMLCSSVPPCHLTRCTALNSCLRKTLSSHSHFEVDRRCLPRCLL